MNRKIGIQGGVIANVQSVQAVNENAGTPHPDPLPSNGKELLYGRLRAGQKAFFEGVNKYRLCAFKARRQYGKTTTLATIALKRMCALPNHTIIFGTARLNLASEMVRKKPGIPMPQDGEEVLRNSQPR
jgi:hypothetical protein